MGTQAYTSRRVDGGVNNDVFAYDIGENEAVDLRNIDGSTPGQRRVRAGTSIAATGITLGPVYALAPYSPRPASANSSVVGELLAVSPGVGGHNELWKWDGKKYKKAKSFKEPPQTPAPRLP